MWKIQHFQVLMRIWGNENLMYCWLGCRNGTAIWDNNLTSNKVKNTCTLQLSHSTPKFTLSRAPQSIYWGLEAWASSCSCEQPAKILFSTYPITQRRLGKHCPRETPARLYQGSRTWVFIASLFVTAKRRRRRNYLHAHLPKKEYMNRDKFTS